MNIFLAPRSSETSYKNFLSTIENGVDFSLVERFLDDEGRNILGPEKKLYVWGNKETRKSAWDKMRQDDLVLFYKQGKFVYAGRLLYKYFSKDLGLSLWPAKKNNEPWVCIFFLRDLKPINMSIIDFNNLSKGVYHLGSVQGFMPVKEKVVANIIEKFGTLEKFVDSYIVLATKKILESNTNNVIPPITRKLAHHIDIQESVDKEANILDFKLVQSAVEKYKKEHDLVNSNDTVDHDIFLSLCMNLFLGLSDDEILEALVSGKQDGGIDALYIDSTNEKNEVYLIQAKYHKNEEKYDRHFAEDALIKMQVAISGLLLSGKPRTHGINVALSEKLKDVRALINPKINIIFVSNSAPPSIDAKNKFQEFIDSKQGSGDYFSVKYISLIEVAEKLRPKTRKQINAKLRLTGKYFDWTVGGVK